MFDKEVERLLWAVKDEGRGRGQEEQTQGTSGLIRLKSWR